ncbi:glycosyltransferase family 2 protein [Rhodocaloribacter litoris]|uniref:glycosyltransferase family 2 protein n=1 Tax=Rhodocaloribacter litoris TaxID=2558931 RepID=UPI00141F507A|nr:glycosyltransferase family 2 protein [Rhodocaloribacter litoris]QXD17092.1 glycosyltransferase family 2 protein [Rhodocaloribacter litoris]
MENPELSIIVPVLDEAASLPELARRLRDVCGRAGYRFEVWLVDDGSTDGSWEVIERLHEDDPRFLGLRFRRNYGKSAALAVGFERARGRYVVTLDADLQDDPEEIPALIELLESGHDLVSGWKKKRRDPLSKTIPSRFFNFITRIISGIPLHDFNCGLKAYRREVVKSVRIYGELHRYIPVLAKWEGFDRITEKPVAHHPRQYGRTKFGLERFIRGFLDLLTVLFMTRFAARPMHFFGTLGTLAFIGGFLVSLWITLDKLIFGNYIGDRPLLLLGVLLILVGVQMFTTGLIGEILVRPRMERTEAYQIREALLPDEQAEAV